MAVELNPNLTFTLVELDGGGFDSAQPDGTPSAPVQDGLTTILSDGFETGNLSKTQNGASWGASNDTTVVTDNPFAGSNSLQFRFFDADSNGETIAEQRFDLGALYKEVRVAFRMYIPDGTEGYGTVAYQNANGNNKLMRLWGSSADDSYPNGYGSLEKVGFELYPRTGGGSRLVVSWNSGSGMGPNHPPNNVHEDFITPSDYGSWLKVELHYRIPSGVGAADGFLRATRNDVLVVDNVLDNYDSNAAADHAWQHGYLMGYQNDAIPGQVLKIHWDEVTFSGAVN